MKILLTNDDGIYSEGIKAMAEVLYNSNHEFAIVAPDRERSASGHSITLNEPLRAEKIKYKTFTDIKCYKISGTPADCVKLGIETLIDFKPDLILSGINNGANLGYDVLYSGTVSAAIEGWMMGFTSLAVSLDTKTTKYYKSGAEYINSIINTFNNMNKKMLININIPDLPENKISGSEITKLSKCLYDDHYETRIDPMGDNYYWLTGEIQGHFKENTDIWALRQNRISITPLQLNLTNLKQKKFLENNL